MAKTKTAARKGTAAKAAPSRRSRPLAAASRAAAATQRPATRERVTGKEAKAARAATRPAAVPRHSGDRRPTEADVAAAKATLERAGRNVPPREKVRATKMGFYDHKRRRKGDVFSLKDPKHFTRKWMARVDASTPDKITTGREELKRQHDEILGARLEGRSEVTETLETQEEEVDNPLED